MESMHADGTEDVSSHTVWERVEVGYGTGTKEV
jgi:hypothetical protein